MHGKYFFFFYKFTSTVNLRGKNICKVRHEKKSVHIGEWAKSELLTRMRIIYNNVL